MSKKKKKSNLVPSQEIQEKVKEIQRVSDTSEEVIIESPNNSDDIILNDADDIVEGVSEDMVQETTTPSEDNTKEDELSHSETTQEEVRPSIQVESKDAEEITDKKMSRKMWIILSVCLFFIMLLFLLFSTVFALVYGAKPTMVHGISIKNIDVSSLTKEQALEKISTMVNEKLEQPISFVHNDYETTVFPEQFNVAFALEEAVDMAYAKGRSRKYFSKQL